MLSAKSLAIVVKPSGKSLIKTKKSNGTRIEICRSRALLIIVDVHKNYLAENLADYWSSLLLSSSEYLKSEINITFSKILEESCSNNTDR